jgi:hypothetical protein
MSSRLQGRKGQAFFESFYDIDTERIVFDKPEVRKYFGSEYWYSYAYYRNEEGGLDRIYYMAPEKYSHFGLSFSYAPGQQPKGGNRDHSDMSNVNGIQLTYMYHSNDTCHLYDEEKRLTESEVKEMLRKEDPEIAEKFREERDYRLFIEKMDGLILDEVQKVIEHDIRVSDTGNEMESYLPESIMMFFRGVKGGQYSKTVRPSYSFPDPTKRTSKSDKKPNNSPRTFLPVNIKGKGENMQCAVDFYINNEDEDEKRVSAFELIEKRGFIRPVIYFEGFAWNGKKTDRVSARYRITEGRFRESSVIQNSTSFLKGKKPAKNTSNRKKIEIGVSPKIREEHEDNAFSGLKKEQEDPIESLREIKKSVASSSGSTKKIPNGEKRKPKKVQTEEDQEEEEQVEEEKPRKQEVVPKKKVVKRIPKKKIPVEEEEEDQVEE